MNDYSKYRYARTIRFFEAYYPYDTENVNYAELMLSMDKLSTIDELFSVEERISNKYFSSTIIFVNLPEDICKPLAVGSGERFGQTGRSIDALNRNMRKDIFECYNANIIRIFKESKDPTISFCGECIVNMLDGFDSFDEQKKEIIKYAKEEFNIDEELSRELSSRKTRLHDRLYTFNKFKEEMNGYISAKQKVQEDLDFIMQYKWRLSKYDKDLFSEFLPPEMRNIPEPQNKKSDNDLSTGQIISIIVGCLLIGALIAWAGSLFFLFLILIGALLLKCWR